MRKPRDLLSRLQKHNWYYELSDHYAYWNRWKKAHELLVWELQSLGCPYSIDQIKKAIRNLVFENFVEKEPNQWYSKKNPSHLFYSSEDLIHKADQVQILAWIESQD